MKNSDFNARYYRTARSLVQDLAEMIRHPKTIWKHYSTGFITIIFVILAGQILITNVFGEFFGVAALSLKDWALLIAVTCPVLVVGDIYRFIRNMLAKWNL